MIKVAQVYIKPLKQVLNHCLVLKKVHRVIIKFNKKHWLIPYINMNTKLRGKLNHYLEKNSFKLMNNIVFGKALENVREHTDVKLVTKDRRGNYLESERNYHSKNDIPRIR